MSFPINSVNEREYPSDWSGEIVICDIDRTYLYTRFSSLKGLANIPFEFAVDKKDIAGMVPLLREVRRGPAAESRSTPLYFISASPSQLRPVIQRKMLLDGLEFDGTTFKDWVGVLSSLRLGRFKEQLGYKLTALVKQRCGLPAAARQILIGDDLESDALVFAIYADALSGRLEETSLMRILSHHGVATDDAEAICDMIRDMPARDVVKRAYIRMEKFSAPEALIDFWPHVAVCLGAFQMALGLWDGGSISTAGVVRVARNLHEQGQPPDVLDSRLRDACARGLLERARGEELRSLLAEQQLLVVEGELPDVDPAWRRSMDESAGRWTPAKHIKG